jgi:hypothetical protein
MDLATALGDPRAEYQKRYEEVPRSTYVGNDEGDDAPSRGYAGRAVEAHGAKCTDVFDLLRAAPPHTIDSELCPLMPGAATGPTFS